MKRDIVTIRLNDEETLVLASDNSGGIGEKQADTVRVPYNVVGYYSFRVAVMECMAARATPVSVVIHNFCGDSGWGALTAGIQKGIDELAFDEIQLTGSTESNFTLLQSAVGMLVIGKRANSVDDEWLFDHHKKVAVIGSPLVGDEVIDQADLVAPLTLFQWCCNQSGIEMILPIGSKGILYELNQLFQGQSELLTEKDVAGEIDIRKSSGPATCFIIAYDQNIEGKISAMAGGLFHPLEILRK